VRIQNDVDQEGEQMKAFRDLILNDTFIYPLRRFSKSDTFRSVVRPTHMGLDFAGQVGDEVLCMWPGVVLNIYAAAAPGGMTVHVINRDDPNDPAEATYSHLDDPPRVKVGQAVMMGDVLGTLARVPPPPEPARPHCHVQLRRRQWLDPEIELRVPKIYP
jgi:murein DD-endopeptidase MepM/ murein hydrolase activator NlpD